MSETEVKRVPLIDTRIPPWKLFLRRMFLLLCFQFCISLVGATMFYFDLGHSARANLRISIPTTYAVILVGTGGYVSGYLFTELSRLSSDLMDTDLNAWQVRVWVINPLIVFPSCLILPFLFAYFSMKKSKLPLWYTSLFFSIALLNYGIFLMLMSG